jgi:tetratricopeptide (TPR) repeat protein
LAEAGNVKHREIVAVALGAAVFVLSACAGGSSTDKVADTSASAEAEATSLLGQPLRPRPVPAETRQRLEEQLAAARASYERAPNDADSIIWLGRRLGYLERYRDAIAVFSEGIEKHPDDARLYRHRGHRLITLRRFDDAIADFTRAAELTRGKPDEVEPDGAPNKRNIPTSTTQGNIYYHLALAHYLKGDYAPALEAWRQAMRIATNDDTRVAVSDWLYMTLRRLGRDDEARKVLQPITAKLDIIENTAYHKRLLFYKGELPADSLLAPGQTDELQYVTQGYGVGNWYLAQGDSARAREIFDAVLRTNYWAAFGYIAAEADVARERAR